ncbi:MAG: DEAD/DEAH box helicase, partial [Patescibacteria group bacterium]
MTTSNLPNNLSAQAYFIAGLPPSVLNSGVLWYLPNAKLQAAAKALLKFFISKQSPVHLFDWPTDFTDWLMAKQSGQPFVLTLPAEYLNLNLPSPTSFDQSQINLTLGQTIKPFEVLKSLESTGYQVGPLADQGGWFVKNGGQIKIATRQDCWLISWQNDTIETIKKFNLETDLPLNQVINHLLLPAWRLPVEAGSTIKNFVNKNQLLLAAPSNLDWPSKNRLDLDPLKPSPLLINLPHFAGQWELFYSYLESQLNQQQNITILTAEPTWLSHQLKNYLTKIKLQEVPDDLINDLTGFKDLAKQSIFLTDREIIGLTIRQKTSGLKSYEKISPGDYLVHIDHGLGRFIGLSEQTVDGLTREYFSLAYADGDKLFVPIEHTDRLSRYLGSPHPKLQKLSSASWWQITKKVKAEAGALASELLKLYAQREQSRTLPWQSFPEEDILAANFPWPLTADQLKTWQDIASDLEKTSPMDRLICGDVGFGKTELAVRAGFKAVLNGYQVALLVPTTILAQQHFDTFNQRLKNWPVKLGLLSRAQNAAASKQIKLGLADQTINIVIGTHALLNNDVVFKKLGLLIIDEEQRFGVKQKEQLKKIRPNLHVLSLSATPIPRTLNLALASIRDLSVINTPPSNRLPIKTQVSPLNDQTIKQAITYEINRGGQIFYLVNRIKDLPAAQIKLAKLLPSLNLGVIHGQLPPKQIADTMRQFDQGQLKLLLATALIEHGLDFPGVNTLIVEKADQFGLSDLYQLRGRVGRSAQQAYAYFFTSQQPTDLALNRLNSLLEATDLGSGLSIALKDIELRGAGA